MTQFPFPGAFSKPVAGKEWSGPAEKRKGRRQACPFSVCEPVGQVDNLSDPPGRLATCPTIPPPWLFTFPRRRRGLGNQQDRFPASKEFVHEALPLSCPPALRRQHWSCSERGRGTVTASGTRQAAPGQPAGETQGP